MDNQEPIRIEISLNVPVNKVWEALTNVTQMREWYFENIPDFKPEEGFETKFEVKNGERIFTHIWKITEVIPFKKISYTWKFEEYPGEGLSIFLLYGNGGCTVQQMRAESLEHTLNRINKLDYTYRNTGTTYTKMCTMTVENTLAILADKQPMANCIYNRKELSTN